MTREEAKEKGIELEKDGWKFYLEGKKPFHTYTAEKDGVELKASSPTRLVEKIEAHLNLVQ